MPGVPVSIGGTTRHLLYDLNALCTLKEQHGINLLAPSDEDTENPVVLRALLWAGFLHETPDLDVKAVGHWVTMDRIEELAVTFAQALQGSVMPVSPDGLEAVARNPTTAPAAAVMSGPTSGATATASATGS